MCYSISISKTIFDNDVTTSHFATIIYFNQVTVLCKNWTFGYFPLQNGQFYKLKNHYQTLGEFAIFASFFHIDIESFLQKFWLKILAAKIYKPLNSKKV